MIRVDITDRDGGRTREVFDKPEVTIGRVQGNDIVLPRGNISKRHARLVCKDDKYILVDLKSTNGCYLNGKRITSPVVVREDDDIVLGDFRFTVGADDTDDEDTLEVDATELRLLAGVAQRDEASRLVYADWLEEHGDSVRAEFLRVQEVLVKAPPDTPQFRELTARMRELAPEIDVRWRYKIARPAIENCVAVEFECPRDWGSLATTEKSSVRYCGSCAKRVYYCESVDAARRHAGRGNCVAVDIVQLRRPGDLEPPRRTTLGVLIAPPADRR